MTFLRAFVPGWILLCAAASLAGCQSYTDGWPPSFEVAKPPIFFESLRPCVASRARFALGQLANKATIEEARLKAGASEALALRPEDAPVTYTPERLIVDVDSKGRAIGLRCA